MAIRAQVLGLIWLDLELPEVKFISLVYLVGHRFIFRSGSIPDFRQLFGSINQAWFGFTRFRR